MPRRCSALQTNVETKVRLAPSYKARNFFEHYVSVWRSPASVKTQNHQGKQSPSEQHRQKSVAENISERIPRGNTILVLAQQSYSEKATQECFRFFATKPLDERRECVLTACVGRWSLPGGISRRDRLVFRLNTFWVTHVSTSHSPGPDRPPVAIDVSGESNSTCPFRFCFL